jgi:oxygen-dependent protoporphyrinogen oxidase
MPTNSPTSTSRRVAVIGGGITGLAAAHRLLELDSAAQVTLFEASGRLGGVLRTERRQGFLLEHSADNFITTTPWGLALARQIGFEDQLIPTNQADRRALVVHDGRLEHVPEGFALMAPRQIGSLLATPVLSLRGKLRLLGEYFVPRRKATDDESLADFARRRLGVEAYERLIQPLVGGIYTADAEKLSIRATLSRFVEMEQRHGSLIRALRKQSRAGGHDASAAGARYSLFVAPRDGMSSLIDALAGRLPPDCVRLSAPVEKLALRADGRWQIDGETFDAVIVAVPAHRAARLLAEQHVELAAGLTSIRYAGCAIALVGYRRADVGHPLDGFGFVVPEIEGRRILACSFSSNKFPGRAPEGEVLLRVFVGGARHPEQMELNDDQLRRIVREELSQLLSIRGEPTYFEVARWTNAMPQYYIGHTKRVEMIESIVAETPGLALAGNAYRGVGIPDCIHSGQQAAEKIVRDLNEDKTSLRS